MWQQRDTDSILIVLTKISWAKMRGKTCVTKCKKTNILFASAIITLPNNLIIKVSKILYRAIDTKVMGGDDG